jgi:hypothetical protein
MDDESSPATDISSRLISVDRQRVGVNCNAVRIVAALLLRELGVALRCPLIAVVAMLSA